MMCIIIDANRVGEFFTEDLYRGEFAPIADWIEHRGGILVYGGKLKAELLRSDAARRRLRVWNQAGRARDIDDQRLVDEERAVHALGLCRSEDEHVIALARCSGARVLCTEDNNLMRDFRNIHLVPRPQGKIYRNRSHQRLLQHHGCGEKPVKPTRRRKA